MQDRCPFIELVEASQTFFFDSLLFDVQDLILSCRGSKLYLLSYALRKSHMISLHVTCTTSLLLNKMDEDMSRNVFTTFEW